MTELVSPHQNPIIRKYLKDVLAWHGYIRFLGMPTLQTNPDVPIDELYVAQSLSLEDLPTDKEPKPEQLHNPVKLLLEKHHLIVLGDPGSGKSTLINWFAWQLASGFVDRLPKELSDLIPIPIVLRELRLDKVTTFEDLLDSFLERPIAKNLKGNRELLLEYCKAGQILLLVDGLDEVSQELRERLQVVFGLFFLNSNSSFSIFTCRKIGYDVAPLGFSQVGNSNDVTENKSVKKNKFADLAFSTIGRVVTKLLPSSPVEVFLAPFSDKQISQFSLNWYRENLSGNEDGAGLLRDDFIISIRSNESTLQLARTPHLLTMMALIFKIRSNLPNGRAVLYDLIAQAYLESIDKARRLKDPFSWQDKKRWLAKIAFEMQMQRTNAENRYNENSRELLATRKQVLGWITTAVQDSYPDKSMNIEEYASSYLDWIARRSGLLLPRGDEQFAFLHLSFQEYFSAIYVQQQIENPEYSDSEENPETLDTRFSNSPLESWVRNRAWQQVFIFLFEIMAEKPGWMKKLWKECFNTTQVNISDRTEWLFITERSLISHFDLQVSLLRNPHVRPYIKDNHKVIDSLIDFALTEQVIFEKAVRETYMSMVREPAICSLLYLKEFKPYVINSIGKKFRSTGLFLDYLDYSTVSEVLCALPNLADIKTICIKNSTLRDLSAFSELKNIETMCLFGCNISNVSDIGRFSRLKYLNLSFNPIESLAGIELSNSITYIELLAIRTNSLATLTKLKSLKMLICSNFDNEKVFLKMKSLELLGLVSPSNLSDIPKLFQHRTLRVLDLYGVEENRFELPENCKLTVNYIN